MSKLLERGWAVFLGINTKKGHCLICYCCLQRKAELSHCLLPWVTRHRSRAFLSHEPLSAAREDCPSISEQNQTDKCILLSGEVLLVPADFTGEQKRSTCSDPAQQPSQASCSGLMASLWGWLCSDSFTTALNLLLSNHWDVIKVASSEKFPIDEVPSSAALPAWSRVWWHRILLLYWLWSKLQQTQVLPDLAVCWAYSFCWSSSFFGCLILFPELGWHENTHQLCLPVEHWTRTPEQACPEPAWVSVQHGMAMPQLWRWARPSVSWLCAQEHDINLPDSYLKIKNASNAGPVGNFHKPFYLAKIAWRLALGRIFLWGGHEWPERAQWEGGEDPSVTKEIGAKGIYTRAGGFWVALGGLYYASHMGQH